MKDNYFSYLSDDATQDLNEWLLGLIVPGVYRGFDAVESRNDLSVRLQHTTTRYPYKGTDYGLLVSQDGQLFKPDATIVVGNTNPTTTQPRIDLLVFSHTYLFGVAGGAAETYSILNGTPSANPVAPYHLVQPNMVVLGELSLPANCTALNQSGVKYTRAVTPAFAENPRVTKTYIYNNIAARNADLVWDGKTVYVKDATADSSVPFGGTSYVYDLATTAWIKLDKTPNDFTEISTNAGWTGLILLRNSEFGYRELKTGTHQIEASVNNPNQLAFTLPSQFETTRTVSFPLYWTNLNGSVGGVGAMTLFYGGINLEKAGGQAINAFDKFYIPNLNYYAS